MIKIIQRPKELAKVKRKMQKVLRKSHRYIETVRSVTNAKHLIILVLCVKQYIQVIVMIILRIAN